MSTIIYSLYCGNQLLLVHQRAAFGMFAPGCRLVAACDPAYVPNVGSVLKYSDGAVTLKESRQIHNQRVNDFCRQLMETASQDRGLDYLLICHADTFPTAPLCLDQWLGNKVLAGPACVAEPGALRLSNIWLAVSLRALNEVHALLRWPAEEVSRYRVWPLVTRRPDLVADDDREMMWCDPIWVHLGGVHRWWSLPRDAVDAKQRVAEMLSRRHSPLSAEHKRLSLAAADPPFQGPFEAPSKRLSELQESSRDSGLVPHALQMEFDRTRRQSRLHR